MDMVISITGIVLALLIGAMSPGPSFVLVARTSIALSRKDGLANALGMGLGGAIFAGMALLGLHLAMQSVVWLYVGFKLLGGLYLLYLAIRLWRGAGQPVAIPGDGSQRKGALGRSCLLGLATQISNPKTAIYYASVFAALMPAHIPAEASLALLVLVFLLESAWYAIVAVAFSSEHPRAAYLKSKVWIDRIAGSVMGLLGTKLIADAGEAS